MLGLVLGSLLLMAGLAAAVMLVQLVRQRSRQVAHRTVGFGERGVALESCIGRIFIGKGERIGTWCDGG